MELLGNASLTAHIKKPPCGGYRSLPLGTNALRRVPFFVSAIYSMSAYTMTCDHTYAMARMPTIISTSFIGMPPSLRRLPRLGRFLGAACTSGGGRGTEGVPTRLLQLLQLSI